MRPADHLRAELHAAEGAIVLEDRGLSGRELAWARRSLRQAGLQLLSVPASQLRWALDGPLAPLREACTGRLMLVITRDDPGTTARSVAQVVRGYEGLRVRGCIAHGALAELVRLVRHVDVYPGEDYRPWLAQEILATAGFGAVH